MADDIPQWAKDRVEELSGGGPVYEAFARYIAAHEEPPQVGGRLGLACGAVADAVFYHASDTSHRTKLALALVDLAQEIQGRRP